MLHAGHGSDRIDVVFDVYDSDSIKSAERIQRGSTEEIAFSNIIRSQDQELETAYIMH